jgi:hypothetical protein
LIGALAAFTIAGCNSAPTEDRAAAAETVASQEAEVADAKREAVLVAREQALAEKEAELARSRQQEAELAFARREAELAKREAALAREAAAAAAAARSAQTQEAPGPASTEPIQTTVQSQPVAQPKPITVPAGTRLSVSLASDVTTKTAKVGDAVHAKLAADVIVDGRTAVAAGTAVHGTVTQVVSGSQKIGGVPTLGLAFDGIDLGNGKMVPISGQIVQQGKSETAKDTGKILGGAALGAIIGKQVGDDKGKVIGGVLGGAAGAAAAHKTGGEVTLTAGSVLVFATEAPFEVSGG